MKQAPSDEENYAIGGEIARGGMGSILMAQDRKLGRKVALKVMRFDQFSDEALRRRFVREAHVLARLAHPNIVPIYDLVWEDGVPQFYTMKLVQGRTLQAILDDVRQGHPETCRDYALDHLLPVFLKVCDAMAFAHSQGVVHRDLKPANVMVGEFGEVLVMDWGLAGLEGDDPPVFQLEAQTSRTLTDAGVEAAGMSLTMDGVVMGTPRYMSPEQAQGRVEEIDALSDIFSLGGILYTILTLRPPVDGSTVREMLEKISIGRIEPPTALRSAPSEAQGTRGQITLPHCPRGIVPKGLSSVAMKAMALDRSRRHQSVTALAADIVAHQGGFSTSAEEIGAVGESILFMKRHKTATAALLAILSLSVGFILKLLGTAESERRAADSERRTSYSAMLAQALGAREHHDLGQARRLLGGIDPELRGFDWRLLDGLCRGDELLSFRLGDGSGAEPQCLALVPGKPQIALISADGHLHLRTLEGEQATSPRLLPPLPESRRGFSRYAGLAFSPNGQRFAYANGDVLQVVDSATCALLHETVSRLPQLGWLDEDKLLFGFNGSAAAPPFPQPGAWILDFRGVHDAGQAVATTPFPEMCAPLAVSPDRRSFVLHRVDTRPESWARSLHVYRTSGDLSKTPTPIYTMPGREYPGKLAFSPSGTFLAFSAGATLPRSARVLEVSSGHVIFDHEFRFRLQGIAIGRQEHRLGLVGADSVVRLYDFTRGSPVTAAANTYDDDVDPARCQQVDGRGAHAPPRDLITRSAQDGRAWFLFGHEKRVLDLAFDANGGPITASGDGTIRRWRDGIARPAVRLGYLDTTYDLIHPAASADGRHVLYPVDTSTWMCDTALSRAAYRTVNRIVSPRHSPLAVLADGRPITQDNVSGDVVTWIEQNGELREQSRIPGKVRFFHHNQTRRGVLSRDEKRLVGTLAGRLFSVELDAKTIAWSGNPGQGASAFANHDLSPDGEWIASCDFGPRVSIHRFREPEKIVTWLDGDEIRDPDTVVAFSRDGRHLYSGNEDGRVRVWDTVAWKQLRELSWPAHLSSVTAMAVSHDRALLATSGDDTLKLFAAEPEPGSLLRREHLSFHLDQSANWIQFARDEHGRDRALLHSAPGRTLEVWETGPGRPFPLQPAPATPPSLAIRHHGALRLPNGRVLVAGGEAHPSARPCVALSDCHLYDPDSGTWSATGSLRTPRTRSLTLTLLPGGKVLVAGGSGRGGSPLAGCELYDLESGLWSATGAMATPRSGGARLLLQDGKVLAAGGVDATGAGIASCELYDPETGAWSPTSPLTVRTANASWTPLANGMVLAIAGTDESGREMPGCELYDPSTGSWRPAGATSIAHSAASVTTLPNGEVLLGGGATANDGPTARCELYNPATGTWRATGSLPELRSHHTATLLRNGKVVLAGGYGANWSIAPANTLVYDPATGAWSAAPPVPHPRIAHTATLLENGRILVVGGVNAEGVIQGIEVYAP